MDGNLLMAIGYGLSAVGYTLLLLLLFTVRKTGLAKQLLVIASTATLLWSLANSQLLFAYSSLEQFILYDNLRQLFWLLFLAACLKGNFANLYVLLSRPLTWFIVALPLAALIAPALLQIDARYQVMLSTVIALEALLLLELIYRQSADNRWAYKPLVLYVGGVNLLDFVLYANAVMVGQIEVVYVQARGFLYFLALPLLVLAIRRISHWGIEIFVSRQVVLHSSLLVAAGGYLLVMAGAGYAVRYLGGQWSNTIQVLLVFLSLVLLAVLGLSNSVKTRIKVFITKHFFANQFDYRQEWITLTARLARQLDDEQQVPRHALGSVLKAIDYKKGLLFKWDDEQPRELANINMLPLNEDEIQVLQSLRQFCATQHWIVDLQELRIKPFVYEGLVIEHTLLNRCRFQLALPLYHHQHLWGFMLLATEADSQRQLDFELRDYLNAVSAQVANYLIEHEIASQLAENAQFAAFNRMSAFVLHDLKNVLAQIDLILCNAQQHKSNPEFIDDTFETLEHTKARMEKMLRQLTDKSAAQQSAEGLCNVSDLVEQVIAGRCSALMPKPELQVEQEQQVVLDKDKFANVLYHLLSNAQQATPDDGQVTVRIALQAPWLEVQITDSGSGMSEDFIRHRLFKPFDTTKGNAGMGIGAYDAKNYISQIGGRLQVTSKVGEGSQFTLLLPLD